ncbi:MAG: hypothetical protein ED557_09830 [Balneola sp.]|nr:MAG: hypothetical protein ED557_09830 [Balneola sp.]
MKPIDSFINKKRLLSVVLFTFSALIVWGLFVFFMYGREFWGGDPFILGGLLSALSASLIVSYKISPRIYNYQSLESRLSLPFGLGVLITLLSYLLGSVLFGISFSLFEMLEGSGFILDKQAIQGAFLLIIVGFLYCITFMSPGFILGGIVGILVFRLTREKEFNSTS